MGTKRRAVVGKRQADEGARDVAEHFRTLPPKPDWEKLIDTGAFPALILGAERRLKRGP